MWRSLEYDEELGLRLEPYDPLMGVYRLVVAGWFLSRWPVSTLTPWGVDPWSEIVPRPVGEGCP